MQIPVLIMEFIRSQGFRRVKTIKEFNTSMNGAELSRSGTCFRNVFVNTAVN